MMLEFNIGLKYLRKEVLYESSHRRGWLLTYRQKIGGLIHRDRAPHRPNLFLDIRNLMIKEILMNIEEESSKVKETASKLRNALSIVKMKKREPFQNVSGVDAGSQILPLASRRYFIISALVYSIPSGSRFFLPPESITLPYAVTGEKIWGVVNTRREAKLYETAYEFILKQPHVRLILVDGPLVLSNWWNMVGSIEDRKRLIRAINRFLRLCMEEDVVVAGITKRPSARYLIHHMEMQNETEMPDAFLLLHSLMPGERTEIFSPRETLRQASKAAPFMDAVPCPIYSFYGRFSRDWSIPPVRIDLPHYSLVYLNDIADYCYGSSFWEGVPLAIIRADEEVRISKRFMAEVYTEAVSYVGRRRGELSYLAPYWGEGRWMGA